MDSPYALILDHHFPSHSRPMEEASLLIKQLCNFQTANKLWKLLKKRTE